MATPGYISFNSSQIAPDQLKYVLNEYLAYERAEIFRRRLVLGLLAIGILLIAADSITRVAGITTMASTLATLVVLGAAAWVNERRAGSRLRERLSVAGIRKS